MNTNALSINIQMDDILSLDFSMIKKKLQDTEEGLGWSELECEFAEEEYKRFLALKRAYPEKEIVPNQIVDSFWHQHILDTMKYAEDCQKIFGEFIHHYPYFGMNGVDDYQNLCNAFEETKALYFKYFGIDYDKVLPESKRGKCRTQCKPQKCK